MARVLFFVCIFFIGGITALAQKENNALFDPAERGKDGLRMVFYNVENLFEPGNDPGVEDDPFTPEGDYQWHYGKYKKKSVNIAKTILAIGGWEAPDLIGLAEIENWQVLYDLVKHTPLNSYDYRIVHENSPDVRGIDTGVLYRPEKLEELSHQVIPYVTGKNIRASRDILYIRFLTSESDTLHVFVNHWPSRYGGKDQTSGRRKQAAIQLREVTDSLFSINAESKIVIMGDFNDEPDDDNLEEALGVINNGAIGFTPGLYNLMYPYAGSSMGTIYHTDISGSWFLFDQIIVSTALLRETGLTVIHRRAFIFMSPWLLDADTGRPYRSFKGPVFTGGYSDHLPVYFDLVYNKSAFK